MYVNKALQASRVRDLTRSAIDSLCVYHRTRHGGRFSRVVPLVSGISLLPGKSISKGGTLEHQGPSSHDDDFVYSIQVRQYNYL